MKARPLRLGTILRQNTNVSNTSSFNLALFHDYLVVVKVKAIHRKNIMSSPACSEATHAVSGGVLTITKITRWPEYHRDHKWEERLIVNPRTSADGFS